MLTESLAVVHNRLELLNTRTCNRLCTTAVRLVIASGPTLWSPRVISATPLVPCTLGALTCFHRVRLRATGIPWWRSDDVYHWPTLEEVRHDLGRCHIFYFLPSTHSFSSDS